ncbi:MAG: hypothetical protein OQJ95_11395 [Kangiella sp.]|nr:hypothetical protein [Kangiella sp.]MCW9028512.1 hypothetical protein [Kangiella sp.]
MERNTPAMQAVVIAVGVAAGQVVEAGNLAVANANGFAVHGSTALNLTYLGRFEKTVDNTNGADGDVQVEVKRKTAFKWKNSGDITQANLLDTCYIVDSETVAATDGAGSRSPGGVIVQVDDDGVWVE